MALLAKSEKAWRLTVFYQIAFPDGWQDAKDEDLRGLFEGTELDRLIRRWIHGGHEEHAELYIPDPNTGKPMTRPIDEPGYWRGMREMATFHGLITRVMDALADGVMPLDPVGTQYELNRKIEKCFGPPQVHWESIARLQDPSLEPSRKPGIPAIALMEYSLSLDDRESEDVASHDSEIVERLMLLELLEVLPKRGFFDIGKTVYSGRAARCEECGSVYIQDRVVVSPDTGLLASGRTSRFCSQRCRERVKKRHQRQLKKSLTSSPLGKGTQMV